MFTSFNQAGRAIREGKLDHTVSRQAPKVFKPVCGARSISFAEACSKYHQRFTAEHVPAWAWLQRIAGDFYGPQYLTDLEWYQRTLFPGEPGNKKSDSCISLDPTFPYGISLLKPFDPKDPPDLK